MTIEDASPCAGYAVQTQIEMTLSELGQAGACSAEQLMLLVREGVLEPEGQDPATWRFDAMALERLRRALRLMRDFEINPAGVVLVLDLLDENRELRTRLKRLGF
jgi:chaperone modulatory protein CbpM